MNVKPVYLARQHAMDAAYVVHPDCGAVWMLPGSYTDQPGEPYRSRVLEAAADYSIARQHERRLEERRDKSMKRIQRGRTATFVPRYGGGEQHQDR